jgi:hypothetical protein
LEGVDIWFVQRVFPVNVYLARPHKYAALKFESDFSRIYTFSKAGLTQRGIAAREWLRNRPEKVIAGVFPGATPIPILLFKPYLTNLDCSQSPLETSKFLYKCIITAPGWIYY